MSPRFTKALFLSSAVPARPGCVLWWAHVLFRSSTRAKLKSVHGKYSQEIHKPVLSLGGCVIWYNITLRSVTYLYPYYVCRCSFLATYCLGVMKMFLWKCVKCSLPVSAAWVSDIQSIKDRPRCHETRICRFKVNPIPRARHLWNVWKLTLSWPRGLVLVRLVKGYRLHTLIMTKISERRGCIFLHLHSLKPWLCFTFREISSLCPEFTVFLCN